MSPIAQEFGFSRAQLSLGITIAALVAAAMSVPIGLLGVVGTTTTFALLGTASGGMANWIFQWCLYAGANLFCQATVWTSAVASRFESSRGLAFAITLSGASLASAVFPIVSVWLIDTYNWRVGFFGLAAIWLAIVLHLIPILTDGGSGRLEAASIASLGLPRYAANGQAAAEAA